jgi:polysaccharide biosynthesis transport protein
MTTTVDLRRATPNPEPRPEPRPATAVSVRATAGPMPQDFPAEQYRVLGHIVEALGKTGRKVIAVSSPVGGDGKTTTTLNLARTLARSPETRVLLIDADFRRGTIGERLGVGRSASRGLAGALGDSESLDAVVRRVPALNLSVLLSGRCPAMPYEALHSLRMGELLHEARESYDYVLVDTPPVVPVADVRAISPWVDGFFLVVSAHYTPRELLDEALSAMDPEKVVGIVYNGDDELLSRRYRYHYNYYAEPAPRPGLWASLFGTRR